MNILKLYMYTYMSPTALTWAQIKMIFEDDVCGTKIKPWVGLHVAESELDKLRNSSPSKLCVHAVFSENKHGF